MNDKNEEGVERQAEEGAVEGMLLLLAEDNEVEGL